MLKKLIQIGLPLAAPTLIYFTYLLFARRRGDVGERSRAPWEVLFLCGAVLAAISLGAWRMVEDTPRGGDYTPARVVDGKIIPGGVEPSGGMTDPPAED